MASKSNVLKERRGKSRVMLLVWVGLVLAGIAAWWFLRPEVIVDVGLVKRGQAVSAVYGTVVVEPVVQTGVRIQSSGIVSAIHVKKGQVVKEGDLLAEIASESANQQLKEAQAKYETANKQKEIGPSSQIALDAKKKQMEQLRILLQEQNIAQSEYDRNFTEMKMLEERLKTEELNLQIAVDAARRTLESAQMQVMLGMVRSPQDGVVLESNGQLGEVISGGVVMFVIGSEKCHIRAQVNEEDVGALKNGMSAIVRLYSSPGANFKGRLKEVLPQGKNQEYSVLLDLENPPDRFLPGMTGELNIVLGKHENAMLVPTKSVRSISGTSLLMVENGIVRSRPVRIGFKSIEVAEILEGVREGEMVILSDHDLFKPGQSVKAKLRENVSH